MRISERITSCIFTLLCAAILGVGSTALHAQAAYPSKPIRLVVPYPPGGMGDTVARMLEAKWGETLKQTILVDNKAGAGSNIGIDQVARANADGYTVGLFDTAMFVNPTLYKQLPYNPQKDILPISIAAQGPMVLVVNPSLPVNSLQELVALAKAKPGNLSYASAGVGSPIHLAAEMFKSASGLDIVHVPYKGAGPAIVDVVGGQVPMMFALPGTAKSYVAAGKLKAIAITGATRFKDLPDVPTFAQAGVQGVDATLSVGFLAPAGTPPEIVNRLSSTLQQVLAQPDIAQRLGGLALVVVASSPEQAAATVREQSAIWSKVVKGLGVTVD